MTARLQAVHRLPDLEHRNLTKEKAPQGAFFGGGWGVYRISVLWGLWTSYKSVKTMYYGGYRLSLSM